MTPIDMLLYSILPTLLGVGILAYFFIKTWREQNNQNNSLRWQEIQAEKARTSINLRLQAYERMTLLCERIAIPNLIRRLRTEGTSVNDLRLALMIGIQQEFEHNVTQQIYISDKLWSILKIARDNTAEIINIAAEKLDAKADASTLISEIFKILNEQQGDSISKAQAAIRQEAAALLAI
jgi:hypothetical protein